MEIFDRRVCELGEGPYYDADADRVGWVDILGQAVLWRDLTTGETGGVATDAHVGAAVPRARGGWVLCLPAGPVLREVSGEDTPLGTFAAADAAAGRPRAADGPALRANDAKADPAGRLWLGTMAYAATPGAGALYRLDPGATTPVRVLDEVTVSNGLGWSPDGALMYYIDTPTQRIDVFDYDLARGIVSGRREFARVEPGAGSPDGLCVDAAGGVWVALWGGGAVRRYAPDGTLDRVVEVGTPLVTSCAFVGPAYDRLVVTTARGEDSGADTGDRAGLTYVHRPAGVAGLPGHRYAG